RPAPPSLPARGTDLTCRRSNPPAPEEDRMGTREPTPQELRAAEDAAMARAIELASRGLGTTSPNPLIGCVILDAAGQVVGEGFHAYAGGPHGEVRALAQAGERARGGTAVVTMEPCDHTGRTGPCTQALIRAGITRVVAGVLDPNPVAAGGAATLRSHGV